MPTKHAIFSQFSAEDLRASVDHYGLEVTDRRVKTQLIDALLGCERVSMEDVLADWRRDGLKALCSALDMDDSGKRKADLIARLIGSAEEPGTIDARESDSRRERGRSRTGRGKATARTNDNGATTGYEAELWAMADKLRGNMEPSDYKHVALGLIFLKYISDAFEAKRADLLTEALADAERTPRSTSPRTSSGSPRRPGGPTYRPAPSSRASARTSMMPCWPSRPATPRSRGSSRRTTPVPPSTRSCSASCSTS